MGFEAFRFRERFKGGLPPGIVPPRAAKRPRSGKEFNWAYAKFLSVCADSRFGKPRSSRKENGLVLFAACKKVLQKHARTCKKLPVASFCASETAETGRIANGREQGDHVSRRQRRRKSTRSVPSRQGQNFLRSGKFQSFFALLFVLYKK